MTNNSGPRDWTRRRLMAASTLLAGAVAGGVRAPFAAQPASAGKPARANGGNAIKVAVVLGPNNTLIDFAGPWEILSSAANECTGFDVYSVAASRAPVLCDDGRGVMDMAASKPISGLTVVPDFAFADAPQPAVILMGAQMGEDDAKIEWIRRVFPKAQLTASVCTGSFLLAKTGLLDGKSATTNRNAYEKFQRSFPKIKLVRGVRFVDNGTTATATGLTAGVDLALHMINRFYGPKVAQLIADYEEWPSKEWVT
jgi:transcriptional regulator GlxA family with amidase domain